MRAKAIAKVSDPLSTIRRFTDLRNEMEYLAQAVDDAHDEFWGWVQQQEDRRARCSRPIMVILIRRHRLVGLALWS